MKWRRVYRLNGARCTYIYNGVDVDRYKKGAVSGNRDEWLRRWGLDPSAFIVGSIGRLRKEKNHQDLNRALGRLVAQGVHAQCLIAGDGPERNALRGMAADLGVEERVQGDVDRLTQILKLIHDRPNLRQALGDVGRVMVEERFSFSQMVDEHERLAFAK